MLTLKEKIKIAIPYFLAVAVIAIAIFVAIPTTVDVEKSKKIRVVENQAHTERMEVMDAILQDLKEINQHLDELKSVKSLEQDTPPIK